MTAPLAHYDPQEFNLRAGGVMPAWFKDALTRREVSLEPEPEVGSYDWARPIRVRKTGALFPLGSVMSKGDLFAKPI